MKNTPDNEGAAMKKTVGGIDRTIRIVVGSVLLLAGIFVQMGTGWRIGALTVAAVAYLTAFTGL
jgi:hypothetical protein